MPDIRHAQMGITATMTLSPETHVTLHARNALEQLQKSEQSVTGIAFTLFLEHLNENWLLAW